jgi:hypothetical protein
MLICPLPSAQAIDGRRDSTDGQGDEADKYQPRDRPSDHLDAPRLP